MNEEFIFGMVSELEKSAKVNPGALAKLQEGLKKVNPNLAAGMVGGAAGGAMTSRRPGESKSDYAKRTALAAGGGALIGMGGRQGISALMKQRAKAQGIAKRKDMFDTAKATISGLGATVPGFMPKGSKVGGGLKGAKNIMENRSLQTLVEGGGAQKALREAGEDAVSNQKKLQAIGTNFSNRREMQKAERKFLKDMAAKGEQPTSADIKKFRSDYAKKKGYDATKSTLSGDIMKTIQGGKVSKPMSDSRMAIQSAAESVGISFSKGKKGSKVPKLDFGKMTKSKGTFGMGPLQIKGTKSVSFEGGVGKVEKKLNKMITSINANPNIDAKAKKEAVDEVISAFQKQYKGLRVVKDATFEDLRGGGLLGGRGGRGGVFTGQASRRLFGSPNIPEYSIVAGKGIRKVANVNVKTFLALKS